MKACGTIGKCAAIFVLAVVVAACQHATVESITGEEPVERSTVEEALDTSVGMEAAENEFGLDFRGELLEPDCRPADQHENPGLPFDPNASTVEDPDGRSAEDLEAALQRLVSMDTGTIHGVFVALDSPALLTSTIVQTLMWDAEAEVGVSVRCLTFQGEPVGENISSRDVYVGGTRYRIGSDALAGLIPASEVTAVSDELVLNDRASAAPTSGSEALENSGFIDLGTSTVRTSEYIGSFGDLALYRIETDSRFPENEMVIGLHADGTVRFLSAPRIDSDSEVINAVRITPRVDSDMLADLSARVRLTEEEAIATLDSSRPTTLSTPDLAVLAEMLAQAPELTVSNFETAAGYVATDKRVVDRANDRERFSWDYSQVWPGAIGSDRVAELVDDHLGNQPTDDEPTDYGWWFGRAFVITLEQVEPTECIRQGDVKVQTSLSREAVEEYVRVLEDLPRRDEVVGAGFDPDEFVATVVPALAVKPWTELNGFYNTCTRFDSDRGSSRFAWLKRFDTLIYLNTVVDDEDRSIHRFAASSAQLWDHGPLMLGFDEQGRVVRIETQGSVTEAAFRDPAATGRTDISYELVGGPIQLPAEETIHRYP